MNENIDLRSKKVLFCDLDGTLIETISGETFPNGIWDMQIRFEVLDKIKEIKPECLLIVTNQGGIEKGFVNRRNFEFKMEYLCRSIKEYTGIEVEYSYCVKNDPTCKYRKPRTGMLDSLMYKMMNIGIVKNGIETDKMLMIGDASGKEGQFSDSDKKTAENYCIDYMDVEDFVRNIC